jgi:hypothetical protein
MRLRSAWNARAALSHLFGAAFCRTLALCKSLVFKYEKTLSNKAMAFQAIEKLSEAVVRLQH